MYDTWRKDDWEICAAATQAIHRLSDAGLPLYHRVIYGHLQVLQGHYEEALRNLDASIPSLKEPASLMAYFFALSGRTLALLHWGRFGELMQIIRVGTDIAEKNGNDPWLLRFREAWLRTVVLDFEGAGRLCESLARTTTGHSLGQPLTIARFAAGYAGLARGRYDTALQQFQEILDPQITPKFFLHWHWRMNAQLGLTNVWLAAGDRQKAGAEADRFTRSVSSTAEPNLLALASEAQARVSMAEGDWARAVDHVQTSLRIVETFEVPTTAWRVHATCADLYRYLEKDDVAEMHRSRAEAIVLALADSFAADEPLRQALLSAPDVCRIRRTATTTPDGRASRSRPRAGRPRRA